MSRHTYVRNMNVDEEYEDDEYAYGSSYGTPGSDYGLSSSVEQQYMFRRDPSFSQGVPGDVMGMFVLL